MILEKIKELCSGKDITVTELERILGFGNGTIHNWNVRNPTVDKLQKVAEYFNVTIDYLMTGSN